MEYASSMEFHEIPWNFVCVKFAAMTRYMEFHGTWNASISLTRAFPWNSVGFGVRQFNWHEHFHGIPWRLECANFADMSSSIEFHGISGKSGCAIFDDMSSSMEFPPWSALISLTRAVPWNCMFHGFHGTWSVATSMTSSSMQFPGFPWNLRGTNFVDTSSAMEFHGTWIGPISMTRAVLWNSMELGVWQFRWREQFHRIPWNLYWANFDDTSRSIEFHGIPWNLGYTNFNDTSSYMEFQATSYFPISYTVLCNVNQ